MSIECVHAHKTLKCFQQSKSLVSVTNPGTTDTVVLGTVAVAILFLPPKIKL
jgi:hypothetical protein